MLPIKSGVTIANGAVQESNFDDFPLLRFDEMPHVETHVIQSDRPSTGIGEVAVPLVAPAVANAIFAATGVRIRKLPVSSHDITSMAGSDASATTMTQLRWYETQNCGNTTA